MGATCKFCEAGFRNRQAVRAHLRTCEAFRKRAPTGKPIGREPKARKPEAGFDPAEPMLQEVRKEEARLKLREIQAAHRDLDERERERARRAEEKVERERAEGRARQREAEEALQGQAREDARQEIVRRIRSLALYGWGSGIQTLSPGMRLRAIKAVDRELADFQTDEMDSLEILATARTIQEAVIAPLRRMGNEQR